MKINEVEKILDIPKATIRYYEDAGLIKPTRSENDYREYSEEDIKRLKAIIVFRKIGVSVPDIKSVLSGAKELDSALQETMTRLEQQKTELSSALQVCGDLLSKHHRIDEFDAEKTYDTIRGMEKSGSRFASLAKEYVNYETDELRKRGYLPKNPHAPAHRKVLTFVWKFFIVAILPGIVVWTLLGQSWKSTAANITQYAIFFLLLYIIISIILFFVFKRKGSEAEKIARSRIGTIAILIIVMVPIILFLTAFTGVFDRPDVCTDVSKYEQLRSGSNALEEYRDRWGMDESIWPARITDDMDVKDYKMVYYNPWDAQYLGYLVVQYPNAEYKAETERLKSYKSTEYKGYYGVTGESDYELLAINADPYYGFMYAMADENNTIIYAEQVFCNYFMDLKYEKYMPKKYFLDGFDATTDTPYYKEKERELDEIANE